MEQTESKYSGYFDFDTHSSNDFILNFVRLKAMAYRQRFIIIGIIAAAIIIAALATFLTTPIYQAESRVQIESDSNQILKRGEIASGNSGRQIQAFLNGQVEILQSRKMATRIADKLSLASNEKFFEAMNVEPVIETTAGQNLQAARRAQAIGLLHSNISVNLTIGGNIASIYFNSPDKSTAIRIVNAYSEDLIRANIEKRFEATSYAREFLEEEIKVAKKQLEEAERQALTFARDSQIIDASDGVSTTDGKSSPKSITTANLVQANADLGVARTERVKAQSRWNQAAVTPLFSLPEVLSNSAIQTLQASRAEAEAELNGLSDVYKPQHPAYQKVEGKISLIDNQLRTLASNIRNSIRAEYQTALQQEQSLSQQLTNFKDDTLNEQNKRVELNLLSRDLDTERSQYQSLLERYKEVNSSSEVVTNNISIIDKAEFAYKISPNLLINLLLGGFLGTALASVIALSREILNDVIRAPDDIASKLRMPLLGVTPYTVFNRGLMEEISDRKSPISESYTSIRSSLEFSTSNGAPKTMLVTSSQPSEGKSTTSVALAISFSKAGKKVLLIDSDLRNPSLHKYIMQKNNDGFASVLTKNRKFLDQVQKIQDTNIDFIPAGNAPPNPAEILISHNIEEFLDSVKDHYDHIIMDGPPIMGLADSPQISSVVDGTILIARTGVVRGRQAQNALTRLQAANAKVVGVILCQYDSNTQGYGYDYEYSYEYGNSARA